MPELKFDRTKCARCKTVSCVVKCQYMDFKDKGKAKKEWQKVIDGEDSSVLHLHHMLCLRGILPLWEPSVLLDC